MVAIILRFNLYVSTLNVSALALLVSSRLFRQKYQSVTGCTTYVSSCDLDGRPEGEETG